MTRLTIPALLLAAACTPAPICDREAQAWDKYGTQEDRCATPALSWWDVPAPTGIDYAARRDRRMGDVDHSVPAHNEQDLIQARADTTEARRTANQATRDARALLDRARDLGANLTTVRALEAKLRQARFDARLAANAEQEAGARLRAFQAGGLSD